MNEKDLRVLAGRVRSRVGRKLPYGVTHDDVLQDAVVGLLEQFPRYDPECGVCRDAWLVVKVAGILRDRYGKMWRDSYTHPIEHMDGGLLPTDEPDMTAAFDVADALSELPALQQSVMRLSIEGLTQTEIARRLGFTQPYVSQIMKAARERLSDLLGEEYT